MFPTIYQHTKLSYLNIPETVVSNYKQQCEPRNCGNFVDVEEIDVPVPFLARVLQHVAKKRP